MLGCQPNVYLWLHMDVYVCGVVRRTDAHIFPWFISHTQASPQKEFPMGFLVHVLIIYIDISTCTLKREFFIHSRHMVQDFLLAGKEAMESNCTIRMSSPSWHWVSYYYYLIVYPWELHCVHTIHNIHHIDIVLKYVELQIQPSRLNVVFERRMPLMSYYIY